MSRNYALMAAARDYRSDKSASVEGSGIARARWKTFQDEVPDDVWADIYEAQCEQAGVHPIFGSDPDDPAPWPYDDPPAEALEEMRRRALERSELLGFYLAWHLAGGFANLQEAGWHRATLHRKIRRFRDHFGQHPDELFFPWLRLDLEKSWKEELVKMTVPAQEPDW